LAIKDTECSDESSSDEAKPRATTLTCVPAKKVLRIEKPIFHELQLLGKDQKTPGEFYFYFILRILDFSLDKMKKNSEYHVHNVHNLF
jgi:hypothetical protein